MLNNCLMLNIVVEVGFVVLQACMASPCERLIIAVEHEFSYGMPRNIVVLNSELL